MHFTAAKQATGVLKFSEQEQISCQHEGAFEFPAVLRLSKLKQSFQTGDG